MDYFIIKDVDIKMLSMFYMEDIVNLRLVNIYFKNICDNTLHDKIDKINRLADKKIKSRSFKIPDIPLYKIQELILLTKPHQTHDFLKNCNNYTVNYMGLMMAILNNSSYHLYVYYSNNSGIISASFTYSNIRDFLRHALYNNFIII